MEICMIPVDCTYLSVWYFVKLCMVQWKIKIAIVQEFKRDINHYR